MTALKKHPRLGHLPGYLLCGGVLGSFVLILFWQLLFTNRVLASGDILHYFYPYRAYAAEAFREGRIPFWSPYIFSGVPFLANTQAAVFYPLHWPLSWLSVTKQIYWSAALHAWILGMGGLALMRRWGQGWAAGLVTGLVLAGSGFYGGMLGHINQMNASAWLPWLLWTLLPSMNTQKRDTQKGNIQTVQSWLRATALFGLLVALTILAGHTQTAYINLFGIGVLVVGYWVIRIGGDWMVGAKKLGIGDWMNGRWASIVRPLSVYFLGVAIGGLIASVQIVPTLELSELGLRSGGLSYGEVSSFSLSPTRLLWTLFPSYGLANLGVVFGTLGYTEFVAHVGLLGLILAGIGGWTGRRGLHPAWLIGLLLTGMGLFLALGRWNPVYYALYKIVPGFDLFRTPARWMMLYTLGIGILAGLGVGAMRRWIDGASGRRSGHRLSPSVLRLSSTIFILLLAADLLLAARSLPHAHPTAPQAVYDVRTAPAHLLTDPARSLHPAAMGRFLSLSTLTFDPGDMGDWHRILREGASPRLSQAEFDELIVALKAQEILAPNLPMLWQVPAVDGFDGGVLPLQRYNQFMSLLIPADDLVPDGRIREQLDAIPPADVLGLMDARYLITDKLRDLWFEGVYYDRQIGATLTETAIPIQVEVPQPFEATAIHLIGYTKDATAPGPPPTAAQLIALTATGGEIRLPLRVGTGPDAHFYADQLDIPGGEGLVVAFRDVEAGRQEYLARIPLLQPLTPAAFMLEKVPGSVDLTIQAITLVDERTETFVSLLPSDQGHFRLVHSGDVKIYEAVDLPGRAYFSPEVVSVEDESEAFAQLQMGLPEGSPAVGASTAVEGLPQNWGTVGDRAYVQMIEYGPEQIRLQTSGDGGLLVLADAYYPGWQAWIDGEPTQIYPTNVLFRGIVVPPGEHEVLLRFRPTRWSLALGLSGVGFALMLGLLLFSVKNSSIRNTSTLNFSAQSHRAPYPKDQE